MLPSLHTLPGAGCAKTGELYRSKGINQITPHVPRRVGNSTILFEGYKIQTDVLLCPEYHSWYLLSNEELLDL
jgi:hypothetical protein